MNWAFLLDVVIWLPLATGLVVLAMPARRPALVRVVALAGSALTLVAVAGIWTAFDERDAALQLSTDLPWIPGLGARYHVAVDGISLPMIAVTALLFAVAAVYVLGKSERAKAHAFLFLLMETGLLGLFSAQDLLLFYVFFEVGLVPMYFVIGGWGHEDRRYAAMKFFLYTRAGSLAMLLSFLGLYFAVEPHTFSLPAIAAAQPLAGAAPAATLVLFGLLLGFGVKVPTVPVHNWLPDAHVEAPTEGSVVLAAIQLKMGGYGLIRVLLPTLPESAANLWWLFVALGVVSLVYGALAALAQRDFKRLVAYTSVSHMGFVMLGVGVAAASPDAAVRALALSGATYQMVSHALLTGAMFLMAGMLEDHAGTRDMTRFGGLSRRLPGWSALLAVLAFGSFGLPGFSGFVAELQVIGATLVVSPWAAAGVLLGLIITTGLYLLVVSRLLLGAAPSDMPELSRPPPRELGTAALLATGAIVLGIVPWPVLSMIAESSALIARGAGS